MHRGGLAASVASAHWNTVVPATYAPAVTCSDVLDIATRPSGSESTPAPVPTRNQGGCAGDLPSPVNFTMKERKVVSILQPNEAGKVLKSALFLPAAQS